MSSYRREDIRRASRDALLKALREMIVIRFGAFVMNTELGQIDTDKRFRRSMRDIVNCYDSAYKIVDEVFDETEIRDGK
jgi:hypothetical protein